MRLLLMAHDRDSITKRFTAVATRKRDLGAFFSTFSTT